MSGFPVTLDGMTPEWFSTALAPHHPGIEVTDVHVGRVRHGTNTHVKLRLTFALESDVPVLLFAKLPPLDPDRRAAVNRTGMGAREVRFYRHLARHLPHRTPAAYATYLDPETGEFLLVLEDLDASGATLPDPVAGVTPEQAGQAMDDYAALHVRYESQDGSAPPDVRPEAAWVEPAKRGSTYGADLLRVGLDRHRDRLADSFIEVAEHYIAEQDQLYDLWRGGPRTVIHGDGHIGNLFVDRDGRLGFLDWGLVNLGSPFRDVSYFLTMSLSPENRRAHERGLWERYLQRRLDLGGTPIDFADAWRQHRLHAAYTVPASCQIVTFPEGQTPGRERFAAAFLARSVAAIEDLDAADAVRSAARHRA